jgi:hypothetical protein
VRTICFAPGRPGELPSCRTERTRSRHWCGEADGRDGEVQERGGGGGEGEFQQPYDGRGIADGHPPPQQSLGRRESGGDPVRVIMQRVGEDGLQKPCPRPARLTISVRAQFRSRGEVFAIWV